MPTRNVSHFNLCHINSLLLLASQYVYVLQTVAMFLSFVYSVFCPYKPTIVCPSTYRQYKTNILYYKYSYDVMYFMMLCILLLISGDIHPNPGPSNNVNLSIVHNNIRSLQKKTLFIEAELSSFDIITLSETWLHEEFPKEKLIIRGFSPPIRRDRPNTQHGGGVLIYVKKNLLCRRIDDLEVPELEAVWIETKLHQDTLLVGCFYRPPDARASYWDLIDESISKAGNTPHKYIVLGDFNTDILLQQSHHLQRIMNFNNLRQMVTEPTRYTNNTKNFN